MPCAQLAMPPAVVKVHKVRRAPLPHSTLATLHTQVYVIMNPFGGNGRGASMHALCGVSCEGVLFWHARSVISSVWSIAGGRAWEAVRPIFEEAKVEYDGSECSDRTAAPAHALPDRADRWK